MPLSLPIGIQTFRTIREEGYYYVDKTPHIRRLVEGGTHYFLSRPRRFGKSLLVDTLKELFEGNEALFEELAIHGHWDWSVKCPVVRLSFGGGDYGSRASLREDVAAQLADAEVRLGVSGVHEAPMSRFRRLLEGLHLSYGERVVVLVDEYDKPILDVLDRPELARANRDFLRGLYGVIKDSDAHVRFAFVTGVSKFSKASLFSGLNNLLDITLHPAHATICGYADEDLDGVFAPELAGLDRARIREWYNGYSWRGESRVHNPFGILLLFEHREFKAHWFETASPSFLIDTLIERRVGAAAIESMAGSEDALSKFDVGDIGTEALLFQTGYLTIADETDVGGRTLYRLAYPNREVKQSLNERLMHALGTDRDAQMERDAELLALLSSGDFTGMEALFRSFLAGIPYEWHMNNDIARYEGYYASLFYAWFAALEVETTAEDSSSGGRLDLAVRHAGQVFLFEFKVVERKPAGSAIAQIRERGYAEKYRAGGESIHLIGVEVGRQARNLVAFEHAQG